MKALAAIKGLGPVDLRNVIRDPLLKWMLLLPLIAALGIRWLVPALLVKLGGLLQLDLASFYLPLFSYLLIMLAPMIAGMLVGFLLLDQKDDLTLTALQVTPLTITGYLLYRLGSPMLISVVMTFIAFPLAGFPWLGWLPLLAVALLAAPLAPVFALLLGTFASNKVQGFALAKASGAVLLPPMAAWFMPMPWQLAFGLVPTYWPAKLYWVYAGTEAYAGLYLLAGLLMQALLLRLLLVRFDRVTRS
ncbi:MAG: hypothetical protein KAU50_09890 [Candidatus Marinimicrobia bacterium]|nr:hypothetical protein [Candidatus Neomarinimicrobiota bacterium]